MGAPEQPHLPGMGDEPVEPPVAGAVDGEDVGTDEPTDVEDVATGASGGGPGDDEDRAPGEPAVGGAAEESAADGGVGPVEEPVTEPVDEPEPVADEPVAEEPADEAAIDEEPVDEPAADETAADASGETVAETVAPVPDEAPAPAVVDEPDTSEIPLAAAAGPGVEAAPAAPVVPPDEPVDDEADDDEAGEAPAMAAPAAVPAPLHRPRERARTRLLESMKPKMTRGQVLAALLCAGLGFGLVTQIQSTQSEQLDALTQSDLVRLLQEVNTEADKLAEQEARARDDRERLVASETGDREAEALTRKRLQALGVLAGTLPATGPGIRLTLTDPKGEVDAATLLDTLQEVRDAGAEAVQINDVRVVASTSFDDLDGGVKIGGTPVRPPYTYLVIGDSETLDAAMRIPGGVLDVVEQKGGRGEVARLDRVDVTALHRVNDPQYARPAPEASP